MTSDSRPAFFYSEPGALRQILQGIDDYSYGTYGKIQGTYSCGSFDLLIDHVQKDPFAPPTLVRILIPLNVSGFSPDLYANTSRRIGFCDYLTRAVERIIGESDRVMTGSGNSGCLEIASPGQEIVERSSVQLIGGFIEARVYAGLPGRGRRILADVACALLLGEIPRIVEGALVVQSGNDGSIRHHVGVSEDQEVMRRQLRPRGLVGFVADGSILPRRSGDDDRPLDDAGVVPFRSPDSGRVRLTTCHQGVIDGLGIREGVTVITGGGYHGKSTFLKAIQRGVYNHVPRDGREGVVTVASAAKISAEEGRSITSVDVSPFLGDLPTGQDPSDFSTQNASGSTSQAASVVESVEAGAAVLLLDEDTSAANFLARDDYVRRLIPVSGEPIRPLAESVRRLHTQRGISTVLVARASGSFFSLADQVFKWDAFVLEDVTQEARCIAGELSGDYLREGELSEAWPRSDRRISSLLASTSRKGLRVRGDFMEVGGEKIRLGGLEQIVRDNGNSARSLGDALLICEEVSGDNPTIRELLAIVERSLDTLGLDGISARISGNLVRPRAIDIAGAVNRLRSLKVC